MIPYDYTDPYKEYISLRGTNNPVPTCYRYFVFGSWETAEIVKWIEWFYLFWIKPVWHAGSIPVQALKMISEVGQKMPYAFWFG